MAKLFAGALDCPQCGEKLRRWPTLDGSGFVASCPSCDYEIVKKFEDPAADAGNDAEEATGERFRRLLSGGGKLPAQGGWPDSLLEELPPEAREALSDQPSGHEPRATGDGTFRSDTERRLKEHGYYLYEDSRGARLSGPGPSSGGGDLSAMDVVSLAASLGDGVPSAEKRRTCPHCKAAVSVSASQCSWCDGELPPVEEQSQDSSD